jgi:hypothetical protein
MKTGDNVRLRSDGRYEARYIKARDEAGKPVYGYCYGRSEEEAREKREYQLQKLLKPRCMNLLILGAGSHGLDVYEIAKSLRIFSTISFLDDDPNNERAVGPWEKATELVNEYPMAVVAVGDEDIRKEWTRKLSSFGFILPTLIHPTAFIPDETEIGTGSVICARATIGTAVHIGKGCIVTSGSNVPRRTRIPDWQQFEFDKIIRERNGNKVPVNQYKE